MPVDSVLRRTLLFVVLLCASIAFSQTFGAPVKVTPTGGFGYALQDRRPRLWLRCRAFPVFSTQHLPTHRKTTWWNSRPVAC